MAEYISREALIEMINGNERPENERIDIGYNEALNDIKQLLVNDIKQLLVDMPATDVQPVKRGEWEKKSSVGVFRCSLCQHIFMLGADEIDEYHFCPNCGADMRGAENG